MKVVLFDIDGTLIRSGGAGVKALMAAMREEFGVDDPVQVPVHGCTDRGITRALLEANGLGYDESNWNRFMSRYLSRLPQMLADTPGDVLPGVLDVLDALTASPQVLLGLLTGNVRAGADLKLRRYGLDHYFVTGGFGDHHENRDDVARMALAEVQLHLDRVVDPEHLWVIGDTPADVRCGRAIAARVLAVGTGGADIDALCAASPDLLVDDLTGVQDWVESFLS